MDKPLTGKTVLVTGAAKRIGRSIALALAERGADVAITYLASQAEAEETVHALGRTTTSTPSPSAAIFATPKISSKQSPLSSTTSAASTSSSTTPASSNQKPSKNISVDQWDAMFTTNTRAPFLMAKAAYPHLRAVKGRILNIGSLGGLHPWATHAHYCTSKAALHMLSKTMAKAWAPEISVNCIAPGMIVQGEVDEAYEHFARKTPMQRNGTAEDVAAAAIFFATAPHFITGQLLAVDGGLGL